MLSRIALCVVVLTALMGQAPPQAITTPPGYDAVDLPSSAPGSAAIKVYVRKPATAGPAPAVVMLHGCGGLFNRKGELTAREVDWIDRFVAAGYTVVLPDSFNPRGFRQICTQTSADRRIRPRDRAEDVAAAVAWLARQPYVDARRIALVGWSNGGSTTLLAAAEGHKAAGHLKTAIAFYPGCRPMAASSSWRPGVPLTILIGAADDWTAPEPCRRLKEAHPAIRYTEYPEAVHGFDAPNSPLRTRTDIGISSKGDGRARIGTNPAARAASIEVVMRTLAEALK